MEKWGNVPNMRWRLTANLRGIQSCSISTSDFLLIFSVKKAISSEHQEHRLTHIETISINMVGLPDFTMKHNTTRPCALAALAIGIDKPLTQRAFLNKPTKTKPWIPMGHHGTSWDITGHHGTSRDIMGHHGTCPLLELLHKHAVLLGRKSPSLRAARKTNRGVSKNGALLIDG